MDNCLAALQCSLFKFSAVLFTEVTFLRLIRSLYAANLNMDSCGSGAAVDENVMQFGWQVPRICPVSSKFMYQLLGSKLPSKQCEDVKCSSPTLSVLLNGI